MRELDLQSDLRHPAYQTKVTIRGYNIKPSVLNATTSKDGARILKKANPAWTKVEHADLARRHLSAAEELREAHRKLLDEAAQQVWGRPFQVTDYRIAAIGSEAFDESMKEKLRFAAYGSTNHLKIGRAHLAASR